MTITIAPINIANAESFHHCLDSVARERRYLAQLQAKPIAAIREFVRANVAEDAVQFVALDGASVVGWADVFPSWADAVSHCGTLGMGVLAAYRGRGIGKQLLLAAIKKAKDKEITRIELEARVDNMVAIRLYERVGFVHEAVKKNALKFDGKFYDAVQMRLLIGDAG